jgi:hypothetical protein
VAAAEIDSVRHIAALCLPQATVEIVLSHDGARDGAPLGFARLDEEHMYEKLPCIYQEAGLHVETVERIPQQNLSVYGTSWGKRLAFGQPRDVWRILAGTYPSEPPRRG